MFDTMIQFKAKSEVHEFFKKQAEKNRRNFPDYMRITLEDLKTQIEQREQMQQPERSQ